MDESQTITDATDALLVSKEDLKDLYLLAGIAVATIDNRITPGAITILLQVSQMTQGRALTVLRRIEPLIGVPDDLDFSEMQQRVQKYGLELVAVDHSSEAVA